MAQTKKATKVEARQPAPAGPGSGPDNYKQQSGTVAGKSISKAAAASETGTVAGEKVPAATEAGANQQAQDETGK